MANLTDTQLLAAIAKCNNELQDATEFRDYNHSATKLLLEGEPLVFRNLNQLKQSDAQPTKVDLNKRVYTASGTAKSATHAAAAFPDSFTKDITYNRLTQKFKVSYKQADNNRLSYENILMYEMKNKLMSLYLDWSTANIAWLNTNRTQVGADSIMTFDETTNYRYDNTNANKQYLFQYIKAAAKKNKYNGMLDIAADQRLAALYGQLASNGANNAVNTNFQMPGINLVEEAQMDLGADSVGFFWERGTVGMTTWNELLNRRGEGSVSANQGLFTTMNDPVFGVSLDLHVKREIADTSASAGNVQDVVDEYEIALTYAREGAWLSTADETSIFKVQQANS